VLKGLNINSKYVDTIRNRTHAFTNDVISDSLENCALGLYPYKLKTHKIKKIQLMNISILLTTIKALSAII